MYELTGKAFLGDINTIKIAAGKKYLTIEIPNKSSIYSRHNVGKLTKKQCKLFNKILKTVRNIETGDTLCLLTGEQLNMATPVFLTVFKCQGSINPSFRLQLKQVEVTKSQMLGISTSIYIDLNTLIALKKIIKNYANNKNNDN